MIKQAREVFPQCRLGCKKKRGVKVWELRVEVEELQEVSLGKECEGFRFGLVEVGASAHNHIPAVLDNSDHGHQYSMGHVPMHPVSLDAHKLCSVNHTSPRAVFSAAGPQGNSWYGPVSDLSPFWGSPHLIPQPPSV